MKSSESGEPTAHTRRLAAVAELGLRALGNVDLSTLMDEALAVVTKNLAVEYGKIFELQPDGRSLLLCSGVGWKDGLVGQATIQLDSPAGCTLASGKPVMLEDLLSEAHFSEPQLLREHGVKSGMTVIIHGREWPFGVLGADTTNQRTFTEDDVSFLQAVANVLATAIERRRSDEPAYQIKKQEAGRTRDEAVERRFAYLGEVAKMLSSSLDYPTTLTSLARLAVPELADWCIVDMLEEEGAVRRSAVAHTDLEKEDLLCELLGRYPFNPDAPYGIAEVLRTGRSKIVPEVLDWMVAYFAHDTEHLRVLRELSIESYIGVPLLSRGRILGAVTLISSESGRYGPEDLALAENFAHCAALALDNARLHHPKGAATRHRATSTHNREAQSPEEEHQYSWLEDYLLRCEGKEARQEYYARLEESAAPPV